VASRRVAGLRRIEIAVEDDGTVEIELPADREAGVGSTLSFRPHRFKLFPA
jgi:sulfate transport system ATP-binding protein